MIQDQSRGQTVLANHAERRKSPRTPIRRHAYVNLEPYDNGGVVTDISADGLRFHMIHPVEQGGLVRLSVILGAANHIQIIGELIWMDASRKIGGIRFTVLPDGAADQILKWAEGAGGADASTAGTPQQNASSEEPSPTAPEPNPRTPWVPPSMRPSAGHAAAHMHARGSLNATIEPAKAGANSRAPEQNAIPPAMTAAMPPAMPWIAHFDPDPPARQSIFLRGVVGGFLIFALVGGVGWFALRNYAGPDGAIRFNLPLGSRADSTGPLATQPDRSAQPSGELPTAPGGSGLTPAPPAKAPSASTTVEPPASGNAGASPTAKLDTGAPAPLGSIAQPDSASTINNSSSLRSPLPQGPSTGFAPPPTTLSAEKASPAPGPQPLAKPPASLPPAASDTGESQLRLARQYLDGRVQPRNPAVASQLLWSAVEKGNSAAEMDLADLYLHGDGVARNCDQARVLLSVASGKGNPEAMQKLRELNQAGCR